MKTHKKLFTSLFLISLSVSLFPAADHTAKAQANSCGMNITNGNFTDGLVGGSLPGTGAVYGWSAAYGTPDVGAGMGWNDAGYVSMWGNLVVGEALQQQLPTPLIGGHTYAIAFGVRPIHSPQNQPYARFRVRASTQPLTSPGPSTGITIGLTGPITNTSSWTPVSFTWTAPAGGPYPFFTLSVENNSNVNDGAMTSAGAFDNFCIIDVTPDFRTPNACQGQPAPFTANAPGATSWDWNFGDSTPHSNQQNPTHTYAAAGTYNVTLCVNGTTNCVTHPVTISQPPPVPVISGPTDTCGGLTATYTVAAVAGLQPYTWTVTNGTINGPSTGNSINVTWNSSGGGGVTVTATNQSSCSSSASLRVFDCKVWLDKCCEVKKLSADAPPPVSVGGNVYTLTPVLTAPGNVVRVAADILSTEDTFSSSACGTNGPANSYIVSVSSPAGFVGSQPVALSHEAIWHAAGGGVNIGGGLAFPFQIQFPPLAAPGLHCSDTLKFCVKYTFTTDDCHSCEIIRCYSIPRHKIII